MSKDTNCSFCNKEISKGLFSGESKIMMFGAAPSLVCCKECFDKYERSGVRFGTKFETVKRHSKKKYTNKEEAEMYLSYLEEEKIQLEKCGGETTEMFFGFFAYNQNGFFSVREYGQGFLNQDVTPKAMIKSMKKAKKDTECCCFDKNDITKIEYYQDGASQPLSMTKYAFSYAIRLNDETIMTYKPCITRTAVLGRGFFLGYKKSSERALLKELNEFKRIIGTDLPIVKVKK